MESKHTPAPWQCYTKGSDIYIEDSKSNGIANIRRNFELPFNEKMANARVISAAPDLLEALINIFKHYDRDNGEAPHHCHGHKGHWDKDDSICEVCVDWEKARAAITKATGELT
jgi:hypothetical protein